MFGRRLLDTSPVRPGTISGLLGVSGRLAVAHAHLRDSTVLHELSHVLFEHEGCTTLPVKHAGSRHMRAGQTVLARGIVTPDFELDLDFADTALVVAAEAEKLSQLLSRLLLRPRHGHDEAVFG